MGAVRGGGSTGLARMAMVRVAMVLGALGAVGGGAALMGSGRQPPAINGAKRYEHGVLTLAGLDASFLTSDAKARRWQEIVKAAGQPVVEEYNRMSIVDTLLNGGWEMVDYEFAIDATGNDVERYVLRRPR